MMRAVWIIHGPCHAGIHTKEEYCHDFPATKATFYMRKAPVRTDAPDTLFPASLLQCSFHSPPLIFLYLLLPRAIFPLALDRASFWVMGREIMASTHAP